LQTRYKPTDHQKQYVSIHWEHDMIMQLQK